VEHLPARLAPRTASSTSRRPSLRAARERGSVFVWALLSSMVVAGIILAGTDKIRSLDAAASFEFHARAQSEEVALAGLVDAYAWFRRQTTQPVREFAPVDSEGRSIKTDDVTTVVKDGAERAGGTEGILGAVVAVLYTPLPTLVERPEGEDAASADTEDVASGLVRTFEIAPGLIARYTVSYGRAAEAWSDANSNGRYDKGESFEDANGNGAWDGAADVRDVSDERGLVGDGSVWYVTSRGEIFRNLDPDLGLGEGQNLRLASSTWGTEMRRLVISPPAAAALDASTASKVLAGSRVRIRGSGTALAHAPSTGSPNLSGAEIHGSVAAVPGYTARVQDVFGVNWPELQSMADISTSDPASSLPPELKSYTLNVVTGDVTFTKDRPLKGMAVLAVRGDVTIETGSNSFFSGVLYVDGDLTVAGPAYLRGSVIVTGAVDLRGSGGDYVEVEQDDGLMEALLRYIGQYRFSKAPFRVDSGSLTQAGESN